VPGPRVKIADRVLTGWTCLRPDSSLVACYSEKQQASPI
jgi:hypothetical protein